MKQTIRLNEAHLQRVVANVVRNIVSESTLSDDYEKIPVFDVLNDDFDNDWMEVLTANLYDRNNKRVGCLRDLHFVYIPSANKLEGSW